MKKTLLIFAAAIALAGCSHRETVVQQPAYVEPAPQVQYVQPPQVVVQQPVDNGNGMLTGAMVGYMAGRAAQPVYHAPTYVVHRPAYVVNKTVVVHNYTPSYSSRSSIRTSSNFGRRR